MRTTVAVLPGPFTQAFRYVAGRRTPVAWRTALHALARGHRTVTAPYRYAAVPDRCRSPCGSRITTSDLSSIRFIFGLRDWSDTYRTSPVPAALPFELPVYSAPDIPHVAWLRSPPYCITLRLYAFTVYFTYATAPPAWFTPRRLPAVTVSPFHARR